MPSIRKEGLPTQHTTLFKGGRTDTLGQRYSILLGKVDDLYLYPLFADPNVLKKCIQSVAGRTFGHDWLAVNGQYLGLSYWSVWRIPPQDSDFLNQRRKIHREGPPAYKRSLLPPWSWGPTPHAFFAWYSTGGAIFASMDIRSMRL